SWSLGSVYGKRHRAETSPYVGAALQMLAGGAAVVAAGTALGEWSRWHLTPAGIGALAYLAVFGSLVGYSAYTYALHHASPTIVGTYAYVNPVIAVLLGWAILREPVGPRTLVAMALTLGAVLWIQLSPLALGRSRAAPRPAAGACGGAARASATPSPFGAAPRTGRARTQRNRLSCDRCAVYGLLVY